LAINGAQKALSSRALRFHRVGLFTTGTLGDDAHA